MRAAQHQDIYRSESAQILNKMPLAQQTHVFRRSARNLVSWNKLKGLGISFLFVLTVVYILRVPDERPWTHSEIITRNTGYLPSNPKPRTPGKYDAVDIRQKNGASLTFNKGNAALRNIIDLTIKEQMHRSDLYGQLHHQWMELEGMELGGWTPKRQNTDMQLTFTCAKP